MSTTIEGFTPTGEQRAALDALPKTRTCIAVAVDDRHTLAALGTGTAYARTALVEAYVKPNGDTLVLRERQHESMGWRDVNRISKINGIDVTLGALREGDTLVAPLSMSAFDNDGQIEQVERLPENRVKVTVVKFAAHNPKLHSGLEAVHNAAKGDGRRYRVIEGDANETVKVQKRAGEGMTCAAVKITNVKTGETTSIDLTSDESTVLA